MSYLLEITRHGERREHRIVLSSGRTIPLLQFCKKLDLDYVSMIRNVASLPLGTHGNKFYPILHKMVLRRKRKKELKAQRRPVCPYCKGTGRILPWTDEQMKQRRAEYEKLVDEIAGISVLSAANISAPQEGTS